MKKYIIHLSVLIIFSLSACTSSIKPEDLYGKWKYIRVEHPNDPTDSVRSGELVFRAPYIQFSANNKMLIMWGGKVLSHGTFSTEGQNIKIKEELPDGRTREFPFWVIKLTDKDLIFETKGDDKSRVTAVKE
jgi:hypothetical protein